MPKKLGPTQWRDLNAELIPRISEWVDLHGDVLTTRGRRFADRAVQRANLAGDAGTRILFEPVLLVSIADPGADLTDLLGVCDRIPFTGNYLQWDYVRALYAAAFRQATLIGDLSLADHPRQMLSYPENGEQLGEPFASHLAAVRNRAEGAALGRSADYPRPATSSPALQHLLGAVREWNILWAYGVSTMWTRDRIDLELRSAADNAAAFIRVAQ